MVGFVRKHWQGGYVLGVAFWLNFVLLGIVYHLLEPYVLRPFVDYPAAFIAATVAYLVVTRLIVYPWQVVGLLRSAERHYSQYDRTIVLYTVQVLVILSAVGTFSHLIGSAQRLVAYKEKKDYEAALTQPDYSLTVVGRGQFIQLRGSLGFGVTKAVGELLRAHPQVTGIILESDGGQIYEGRGLAVLFADRSIDTYTFSACTSSCATAFIGGNHRYLGENGKLGFHQYAFDSARLRQFNTFYDLEAEQAKDLELYRSKDVDEAFLARLFETPSHDMWYPSADELLKAGVVSRMVREADIANATVLDQVDRSAND